jgi:hypothetical protein
MFASSGLMFAVDKIFAGFANQTWRSSLWISELTLWTGQVNVPFCGMNEIHNLMFIPNK